MEEIKKYLNELLGEKDTKDLYDAFDCEPYSAIRMNTLKVKKEELIEKFDLKEKTKFR